MFYASLDFLQVTPVSGALEAVQAMKAMGFRLAIVTTRSTNLHEQTMAWIDKWLPG
jgi:phosphoglycolate phosphatase-like HAD superfamily hydrolase